MNLLVVLGICAVTCILGFVGFAGYMYFLFKDWDEHEY